VTVTLSIPLENPSTTEFSLMAVMDVESGTETSPLLAIRHVAPEAFVP
jgi:hypothetical protein